MLFSSNIRIHHACLLLSLIHNEIYQGENYLTIKINNKSCFSSEFRKKISFANFQGYLSQRQEKKELKNDRSLVSYFFYNMPR